MLRKYYDIILRLAAHVQPVVFWAILHMQRLRVVPRRDDVSFVEGIFTLFN